MPVDRDTYFHALIDLLNAKHGTSNARALVSWAQAEGGNALWNPLNTTWRMPSSTLYNTVGVQNYASMDSGLRATALTLEQTDPDLGFDKVLAHLRRNARAEQTLKAVANSSWGTGALALEVLPYVKANYWAFASHTIAGS